MLTELSSTELSSTELSLTDKRKEGINFGTKLATKLFTKLFATIPLTEIPPLTEKKRINFATELATKIITNVYPAFPNGVPPLTKDITTYFVMKIKNCLLDIATTLEIELTTELAYIYETILLNQLIRNKLQNIKPIQNGGVLLHFPLTIAQFNGYDDTGCSNNKDSFYYLHTFSSPNNNNIYSCVQLKKQESISTFLTCDNLHWKKTI